LCGGIFALLPFLFVSELVGKRQMCKKRVGNEKIWCAVG